MPEPSTPEPPPEIKLYIANEIKEVTQSILKTKEEFWAKIESILANEIKEVTLSISSTKDDFWRQIESIRADARSHSSKLAAALVLAGSIIGILTFFGFKERVSSAFDEKMKDSAFKEFERRAEAAASKAEAHAVAAGISNARSNAIAEDAQKILSALLKRQAASSGFFAVTAPPIELNDRNTEASLDLPIEIPKTSTEILVFCHARSGHANNSDYGFIQISTSDAAARVTTLRLFIQMYPQDAFGFNSDYFWLPYPNDGKLTAKFDGMIPSKNTEGHVQIVGYR